MGPAAAPCCPINLQPGKKNRPGARRGPNLSISPTISPIFLCTTKKKHDNSSMGPAAAPSLHFICNPRALPRPHPVILSGPRRGPIPSFYLQSRGAHRGPILSIYLLHHIHTQATHSTQCLDLASRRSCLLYTSPSPRDRG